jgi:hypothetical protein
MLVAFVAVAMLVLGGGCGKKKKAPARRVTVTTPTDTQSVVWDSVSDVQGTTTVRIRITPSIGSDTYNAGTTNDFSVSNEATPEVALDDLTGGQKGNILLTYSLKGAIDNRLDVTVEYSTDGTNYKPCSPTMGGDGTTSLLASYYGVEHEYMWNSLADIAGDASGVTVRITPSLKGTAITAGADTTAGFNVLNSQITGTPPALTLQTPPDGQNGNILIDYAVFDAESDNVSIAVFASTDNANWVLAARGFGGNSVYNVVTSPDPGENGTYAWNSVSGTGGVGLETKTGVTLMIVASEGDISSIPCYSSPFSVANGQLSDDDVLDLGGQAMQEGAIDAAQNYYETVQQMTSNADKKSEATFYVDGLDVPLSLTYDEHGPNPNTTDSFKEVLDGLGIDKEGRDLNDWSAEAPEEVPADAPATDVILNVVAKDITLPISTFSITTAGFSKTFEITLPQEPVREDPTYLDYGDFQAISAGVDMFLHQIKWFQSYNLDMDFADFEDNKSAYEFRQEYPEFFRLVDAEKLEEAKSHMISAIDKMLVAYEWKKENKLDVEGYLFFVNSSDVKEMDVITGRIAKMRDSLINNAVAEINFGDPECASDVQIAGIDFSKFYTADWAELIPAINKEADCPLFEQMADPTFGGIFPGWTAYGLVHDMNAYIQRDIPNSTIALGGSWPAASNIWNDPKHDNVDGPFHLIKDGPFPCTLPGADVTNFYMAHDSKYFYFGFELLDPMALTANRNYNGNIEIDTLRGSATEWYGDVNINGCHDGWFVSVWSGSLQQYWEGSADDIHVAGNVIQVRIPKASVHTSIPSGQRYAFWPEWGVHEYDPAQMEYYDEWECLPEIGGLLK